MHSGSCLKYTKADQAQSYHRWVLSYVKLVKHVEISFFEKMQLIIEFPSFAYLNNCVFYLQIGESLGKPKVHQCPKNGFISTTAAALRVLVVGIRGFLSEILVQIATLGVIFWIFLSFFLFATFSGAHVPVFAAICRASSTGLTRPTRSSAVPCSSSSPDSKHGGTQTAAGSPHPHAVVGLDDVDPHLHQRRRREKFAPCLARPAWRTSSRNTSAPPKLAPEGRLSKVS
jgi:hypothetical protein